MKLPVQIYTQDTKGVESSVAKKSQIVAAMNPCPCGHSQPDQKPWTCALATVTKYQKRTLVPLLDRIDIHIEAPHVDYEKLSADRVGESSAAIRA